MKEIEILQEWILEAYMAGDIDRVKNMGWTLNLLRMIKLWEQTAELVGPN